METRNFICRILLISFLIPTTAFTSSKCEATGNGNRLEKKNEVKTVLILGNSIVRHAPKPEIGWYGNWGMAASAEDSDFVHLLIRDVHRIDPSVKVKYKNIADFERNFETYSLPGLDSLRYPDMLILKISENVDEKKATEGNFISCYDKLVKYIAPNHHSVKIIVDGFWPKKNVNSLIEEYAFKKKYPFISISGLSKDSTNMAIGKFDHKGVASHPSDKGMRMIKQRIWTIVREYFKKEVQ